jgi:hypothetical protein
MLKSGAKMSRNVRNQIGLELKHGVASWVEESPVSTAAGDHAGAENI